MTNSSNINFLALDVEHGISKTMKKTSDNCLRPISVILKDIGSLVTGRSIVDLLLLVNPISVLTLFVRLNVCAIQKF